MNRKIKNLLLIDFGWMKAFLKPSIQATNVGISKVNIEYIVRYNILGMCTLNIAQFIFDIIWYGFSQFSLKNYRNNSEHKTIYGINREFFSNREIEYLAKFDEDSII